MKLRKYRCLALDHDDTVVRTTPEIHYPSFIETLRLLRPEMKMPTLAEFMYDNCHVGFAAICERLAFSEEEMRVEGEMWRKWTNAIVPRAYEGMGDVIRDFRAAGGILCVISHSEKDVIYRDYEIDFHERPDLVFGWELPKEKRKPEAWALDEIMRVYDLTAADILVVDDMRLGMEMAAKRNVDFAWAGWSVSAAVVGEYMREHAQYAFETPEALREILFENE